MSWHIVKDLASSTHTNTHTHTHFQMLYSDKHALPLLLFDIRRHTQTHTHTHTHTLTRTNTRSHAHTHTRHIYISQWMMGKNDAGRRIILFSWSNQRWEWQHSSSDSECVSDWGGIRSEMMTVRMWVENETFYHHPKMCVVGGRPLSI